MPFDNGGWDAVIEASTVGNLPALEDLLSGRVIKAAKIVNAAGAPRPIHSPPTATDRTRTLATQTVRSEPHSLGRARTAISRVCGCCSPGAPTSTSKTILGTPRFTRRAASVIS